MYKFKDKPNFTPDFSPYELFVQGAFGGGYWRKIYSSVTKSIHEKDYLEFEWAKNIDLNLLCNEVYDPLINKYKTKCGVDLDYWESKNWIKEQDPRGWVQWYCRFFEGRRTVDDDRQINRWLRTVRFKNMLLRNPDSDKLKQVLLHWAIDPQKVLAERELV